MAWHLNVIGSAAEIQIALNAVVVSDTLEAQQFELVKQAVLSQVGLPQASPATVDVGVLFAQNTLHLTAHGNVSNISSRSNFTLQVVNAAGPVNIIGNPDEGATTVEVISGPAPPPSENGGLVWGPTPETLDGINGSNDSFTDDLDTLLGGPTNYTDLSFGNPVTVTNDVAFDGSSNLTSLEFRLLESVGGFVNCSGCGALTSFKANSLQSVGGQLDCNSSGVLEVFEVDSLETVGTDVELSGTAVIETNFPSLVSVGGSLSCAGLSTLTTFTAPVLVSIGALLTVDGALLSEIVLPALTTTTGGVDMNDNPNLVTFSAPLWLPTDGTFIEFDNDALDVTSVNHILARCVAAGLTTANINLSGGTNAAPTGQGIVDAAALTTAGCTVTTN